MMNINEVSADAGRYEYWVVYQSDDGNWYYETGRYTLEGARDYCATWPDCHFHILHHTLTEVK